MHRQIRQDHPGACRICGMALEPVTPAGEAGKDHELRDMNRRFWVALALTMPVVVLAMGGLIPGFGPALARALAHSSGGLTQLLLATPVVLWAGSVFFVRGWNSLRRRSLNMFTLIAMGTGAAQAPNLQL